MRILLNFLSFSEGKERTCEITYPKVFQRLILNGKSMAVPTWDITNMVNLSPNEPSRANILDFPTTRNVKTVDDVL